MSEKDNIILQSLLTMMPDFSRLFQDIAIAFSNTEKYLYYKPTKELDHKIKPGEIGRASCRERVFRAV